MAGKEKYQANRSQDNNKKSKTNGNPESNKKVAKAASKAAADYFAPGVGGAIVDKLADTKLGDAALNKMGNSFAKQNPGLAKAAEQLDNAGALDIAMDALAAKAGSANGAQKNAAPGTNPQSNEIAKNSQVSDSNNGNSSSHRNLKKAGSGILDSLKNKGTDTVSDEPNTEEEDSSVDLFGNAKGIIEFIKKYKVFIGPILPILLIMTILIFGTIAVVMSSSSDGSGDPREDAEINENSTNTGASICGVAGSCEYDIKGVTNGQSTVNFNKNISNIKVRLMQAGAVGSYSCGGEYGKALQGEELVDFEKYVLGVVYGEIGSGHSKSYVQTQAVAARSFALYRAISSNGSLGRKLVKENGQWILQITNCVSDQVYCDPDKGCSKKVAASNQYGNIYSGTNNTTTYKGPLDKNHKMRQWVAETAGVVLTDKSGNVVGTTYASTVQNKWGTLSQNLDYKQILLQTYGKNKNVKQMSCNGGDQSSCNTSTGDFAGWKQYNPTWGSIPLGNSSHTIKSAGCLVTSVSMLIAKSGVPVNVEGKFNPGTFVQKLNKNGGFSGALFNWGKATEIAPKFKYGASINIAGQSRNDKLNVIKGLLNNGYYIVAEVKGNTGQHWVAVDSISGNTINMMDPGSESTNMWQQYNWANTSRVVYYKVA